MISFGRFGKKQKRKDNKQGFISVYYKYSETKNKNMSRIRISIVLLVSILSAVTVSPEYERFSSMPKKQSTMTIGGRCGISPSIPSPCMVASLFISICIVRCCAPSPGGHVFLLSPDLPLRCIVSCHPNDTSCCFHWP